VILALISRFQNLRPDLVVILALISRFQNLRPDLVVILALMLNLISRLYLPIMTRY